MRINEVDKVVTQADIDQLEIFADRLFAKVGIDVEFTRHFLDRVNDERNVRQITISELTRLFKQEFKKWGKKIAQLGPDAEAVMKDLQTDINMPFALRWDSKNNELDLIAKTIMRKQNFRTPNQEFAVEYALTKKQEKLVNESYIAEQAMPKPSAGGVLGTGLDAQQFQQRYGVTPKQATTSINNVVKLRPGFQAPRVTNAITNFMLENPGSFQAANDNVKPNRFRLPSFATGLLGRLLGGLGMILWATPAGDPNEAEILAITNDLHRWMMYNDPQALIDMYDAEWDALTDKQREEMKQWDPENDPNYQTAKDAQRLLDAAQRIRDRRYNELLDRIYDPRNAQPQPAPQVEPDAPEQPDAPANDPNPPNDLPKPANDPQPPHRRPNQPGMPNPDDRPDFWPDSIPFVKPADTPEQPEIPANDDEPPSVEPNDDPKPNRTPPEFDPFSDPEKFPEYDPKTPIAPELPQPDVDPTSPEAPDAPDPDKSPDYEPTTDPDADPGVDPEAPTEPGKETEPEAPTEPAPRPDVDPNSPAQPTSPDPDKSPDYDPATDPDVDPKTSPRPSSPVDPDGAPEYDPEAPKQPGPEVDPEAPEQPDAPADPDKSPDYDPATDPDVDPDAPGQPASEPEFQPDVDPLPSPDMLPQPDVLPGLDPLGNPNTVTDPSPKIDPKTDPNTDLDAPAPLTSPELVTDPQLNPQPAPRPRPNTGPKTTPPTTRRRRIFTDPDGYLKHWLRQYGPHAQRGTDIGLPWQIEKKWWQESINESGSLPGVGAIHIEEINPTLEQLEKALGIDLKDFVLGSVGKREFSGDIDVALNLQPEDIPEFIDKLKASPLIYDIQKTSVILTKVKIVNYDESKSDGRPRTGYVQLDFMLGDPGWLKTYYHSPSDKESKYKGVFRNIMVATMAAVHNRQDSAETTEDGRPLESIRYMWSPADGLVKIRRTPVRKKTGDGYTKKNNNELIDGPWKNADEIAKELGIDNGQQLNSFESLLDAIKKNYTKEALQQVIKGFAQNSQVQDIGVPEELKDAI